MNLKEYLLVMKAWRENRISISAAARALVGLGASPEYAWRLLECS